MPRVIEKVDERRGVLLVLGAALLWSSGGIGIKAIEDSALKVACYRSAIAAVALFLIFRPTYWRWSFSFLAAIVSYGACLTSFVTATKWTTAANAIFLQYSGVVWVMILSPLLLKEKLRSRDVVAIVVALCGMALFFVGKLEAKGMSGNLMALLSGIFFATLVLSLRRERGEAAEAAVAWGNVLTAVALAPFIPDGYALTMKSALVLTFLGVFQIAFAYALFVKGIHHVTATVASLTGMLEPVANPIWVFLFLGERPTLYAIIGALIVLSAIAWRTFFGTPPPEDAVATPD
jgi:DME family drug/metabolite transporter